MANKPVLVFGVQENAAVALAYLRRAGREVVAFTVDRAYLPPQESVHGRPVVAFEDVVERFPPSEHDVLAPLTHQRMNRVRAAVFDRVRDMGYDMPPLIDAGAVVHEGVPVGANGFVLELNVLQPHVTVGDDVVLWSGNHVGHHTAIEDHCFISSHVVIGGRSTIGAHSFLGMNATIRDGVALGEGTFVAMGACVVGDTEPWSVYAGVPAVRKRSSRDLER